MRLTCAILFAVLLQGSLVDARLIAVESSEVQGTIGCSLRQFYATSAVVSSEFEAYKAGRALTAHRLSTTGANYFNKDFEAIDQYFQLVKIIALCRDMVINKSVCGWSKQLLLINTGKCSEARERWRKVNRPIKLERVKNFLNYRFAFFNKNITNPFPGTELANPSNIDEKLIKTDILGDFDIGTGNYA
ncbi:hypothetical protein IWQ61_009960 [Dispira simplex]|nr:hypothetical protein IWQ61_009960 [Dispira simplex]